MSPVWYGPCAHVMGQQLGPVGPTLIAEVTARAPQSRQPLLSGERCTRYEMSAVAGCRSWPRRLERARLGARAMLHPVPWCELLGSSGQLAGGKPLAVYGLRSRRLCLSPEEPPKHLQARACSALLNPMALQ